MFDNFFKKFNKVGKSIPDTKEIIKIPTQIRENSLNINLNKIAVTYWNRDFSEKVETTGEIIHFTSMSLVLFNIPDKKGAILLLNKCTHINRSKNNERCIEVAENYPYGLDRNSDLIKFSDVIYQDIRDDIRQTGMGESKKLYYKDYKLYIPVMLNEIPIPIIRLDDAERLQKINSAYVKQLANISQTFLREWIDIELLKRTNSGKTVAGAIYIAILFFSIGSFVTMLIMALTK